jgi:hypothetical protein
MSRFLVFVVAIVWVGLVGCKPQPAYVGTYDVVMSDQARKELQASKAALANLSPKDREAAVASMDAIPDLTLEVNGDGTWSVHGLAQGQESKGTYTVEGDMLVIKPAKSGAGAPAVGKLKFNAAERTLKAVDGGERALTFKKR